MEAHAFLKWMPLWSGYLHNQSLSLALALQKEANYQVLHYSSYFVFPHFCLFFFFLVELSIFYASILLSLLVHLAINLLDVILVVNYFLFIVYLLSLSTLQVIIPLCIEYKNLTKICFHFMSSSLYDILIRHFIPICYKPHNTLWSFNN